MTPVRVEGDKIIYNGKDMEEGKLYEFVFKEEKWAVRNNGKEVEFLICDRGGEK